MIDDISSNTFLNSLTFEQRQKNEADAASEGNKNELGQSAFLELMVTQLENQDPLSPQDNSAFVAQLAQFSSVEGLERLNKNFDSFASSFVSNQALQASSLVGSSVSVPSSTAQLREGDVVGGAVNLPAATTDMSVAIYNEQGGLVQDIPLGAQSAGDVVFRWDGNRLEVNGQLTDFEATSQALPGEYRFEVVATQGGEPEQLETSLTANVNSVTVGSDGQLVLNLAGLGAVNANDVKQFN